MRDQGQLPQFPASFGTRRLSFRYPGALVGLLAGGFVALILGAAALSRPESFSAARVLGPLALLMFFGLLYDVLRARNPALWRSEDVDRLWQSWLFKTTVYWTVVFPVLRLLQDLATFWEVRRSMPDAGVADLFPYLSSAGGLLGFVVFQALFGTAFGIVFTFLYRRFRGPL